MSDRATRLYLVDPEKTIKFAIRMTMQVAYLLPERALTTAATDGALAGRAADLVYKQLVRDAQNGECTVRALAKLRDAIQQLAEES